MNKPLRHTHKSDTDNFYPDKDLLKHQITKEHFKEITNGKNIKKVLSTSFSTMYFLQYLHTYGTLYSRLQCCKI